jgi:hypothetical protein
MAEIDAIVNEKRQEIFNLNEELKQFSGGNFCVIKRHQNDEFSYHEIINMADYLNKSIDELMVNEN